MPAYNPIPARAPGRLARLGFSGSQQVGGAVASGLQASVGAADEIASELLGTAAGIGFAGAYLQKTLQNIGNILSSLASLNIFGALSSAISIVVVGIGIFGIALARCTAAAKEAAATLSSIRASTGIGYGQGYSLLLRSQALGISQQSLSGSLSNPQMNPALFAMRAGAYGLPSYTDPNYYAALAGHYQATANQGPYGRLIANQQLNSLYGGTAPADVQTIASNYSPRQIQQQQAYTTRVQNAFGLNPEILQRYSERLPLLTDRLATFFSLLETKIGTVLEPLFEKLLGAATNYLEKNADKINEVITKVATWIVVEFPALILEWGAKTARGLARFLEILAQFVPAFLSGLDAFLNGLRNFLGVISGLAAGLLQVGSNFLASPVGQALLQATGNAAGAAASAASSATTPGVPQPASLSPAGGPPGAAPPGATAPSAAPTPTPQNWWQRTWQFQGQMAQQQQRFLTGQQQVAPQPAPNPAGGGGGVPSAPGGSPAGGGSPGGGGSSGSGIDWWSLLPWAAGIYGASRVPGLIGAAGAGAGLAVRGAGAVIGGAATLVGAPLVYGALAVAGAYEAYNLYDQYRLNQVYGGAQAQAQAQYNRIHQYVPGAARAAWVRGGMQGPPPPLTAAAQQAATSFLPVAGRSPQQAYGAGQYSFLNNVPAANLSQYAGDMQSFLTQKNDRLYGAADSLDKDAADWRKNMLKELQDLNSNTKENGRSMRDMGDGFARGTTRVVGEALADEARDNSLAAVRANGGRARRY